MARWWWRRRRRGVSSWPAWARQPSRPQRHCVWSRCCHQLQIRWWRSTWSTCWWGAHTRQVAAASVVWRRPVLQAGCQPSAVPRVWMLRGCCCTLAEVHALQQGLCFVGVCNPDASRPTQVCMRKPSIGQQAQRQPRPPCQCPPPNPPASFPHPARPCPALPDRSATCSSWRTCRPLPPAAWATASRWRRLMP